MIFKKLFSKNKAQKWQSEKESERIQAIAELDSHSVDDKKALHELAFNDAVANVRWQALVKLNDFGLFWQAFKQDADNGIRKKAQYQLATFITEPSSTLALEEKITFIEQSAPPSLLATWCSDINEEKLLQPLLKKVNKDSLSAEALINKALSQEFAKQLVDSLEDKKLLKKVAKHAAPKIAELATNEIASRLQQEQRPAELEQESRLVLAQLKALKEQNDYAKLTTSFETLAQQWSTLSKEFSILDDSLVSEFDGKYQLFTKDLTAKQDSLEADFNARKEQEEKAEREAAQKREAKACIEQYRQALNQKVESVLADLTADSKNKEAAETATQTEVGSDDAATRVIQLLETTETEVADLAQSAAESVSLLDAAVQTKLTKELHDLKADWETFKESAAQLVLVASHVSKLNQLELDTTAWIDAYNEFKTLKSQIKPSSFNRKALSLVLAQSDFDFKEQASNAEQQQKQTFRFISNRLKDLPDLINQGRFNDALGLYRKLQRNFDSLDSTNKRRLQDRWQNASDDIEKLVELQTAITEPKVQELIERAQTLAEQPIADLTEQAYRIKVLRKDWNSLRVDTERYKAEVESFNKLLEKAFEPCREFYSEQEKQRADNLVMQNTVLAQLSELLQQLQQSENIAWKEVEKLFAQLQKNWSAIGLIDKDKVQSQKKQYQTLYKDIKALITAEHFANKEAKQKLIDKAEQIVSSREVSNSDKVASLKQLQNEWKQLGFAGPKADNSLWRTFRGINDSFFNGLSKQRDEEKQASNEQAQVINSFLTQLEKDLTDANTFAEVKDLESKLANVSLNESELITQDIKALKGKINKLEKEITEAYDRLSQRQNQAQIDQLFNTIEQIIEGEKPDFTTLKKAWQQGIEKGLVDGESGANSNQKSESRASLTLKLEIVADAKSPEQLATERQQVQMSMMTEKLEQGSSFDKDQLLNEWLSVGPWNKADMDYLQRVKPLFVEN